MIAGPIGRFAAAVAAVIVVSSLLPACSRAADSRQSTSGWSLVWHDELNGRAGSKPKRANWMYDHGTGFGTGEIETMTSSSKNVYLDGHGHLAIRAIRDAGGNWTSGRIETRRSDFAAPAGGELAVEASIRLPNVAGRAASGYWPAFWMLGTGLRQGGTWPGIGEIDIMENVNGLNKAFGTLHCGVGSGGPCNETNGLGGSTACASTTCQQAFHTYRVEVDRSVSPEQIRWYLDGTQYWKVSADQMDARTWTDAVDHAFFIILDLAMGGGFPNNVPTPNQVTPTQHTKSGGKMLVDYVRVYVRPNGG